MTKGASHTVKKIVQLHSLDSKMRPVDVFALASELGVGTIEKQPITLIITLFDWGSSTIVYH